MGCMIIKSENIYTEGRIISGGILVEDGKIAAIIEGDVEGFSCPITDYGTDRVVNGSSKPTTTAIWGGAPVE